MYCCYCYENISQLGMMLIHALVSKQEAGMGLADKRCIRSSRVGSILGIGCRAVRHSFTVNGWIVCSH